MIEKKFVQAKKDEFALKEFIKQELGKGKITSVVIERTPVGEKIAVRTSKPGLIIGRRGEKIAELTDVLKKKFKLENPHIEIIEITNPYLDAWSVADEIAIALERFGPTSFKIIAYKMLEHVRNAGALGAEIRLGGKLPSERAKSWRFAFGLLKKTGDTAKVVDRARITAETIPGTIGVKVEIMPPDAKVIDKLDISKKLIVEKAEPEQPKQEMTQEITQPENEGKKKRRKKTVKDKETKKTKAE
jgi:small subunit ribosomal protein S3